MARSHLPEFEQVGTEATPADFKPYAERSPRYQFTLDLVPVPGGRVEMSPLVPGGERKTVDVPDLWVGRTEVPCEAFEPFIAGADLSRDEFAIQRTLPHHLRDRMPWDPCVMVWESWWRRGLPAHSVSRTGAEAYCTWLSKKTGRAYRLPTEAEFEHFARAGAQEDP